MRRLLDDAYERFRDHDAGELSPVYPALSEVAADAFGLAVTGVGGGRHTVGQADVPFTIMSVVKPFAFALICRELGTEEARLRVGANATGLPFNSLAAVERGSGGRTNPMVNAGALVAVSLAPGDSMAARWRWLHEGLSAFAGRDLAVDERVLDSALGSNHANRALAARLADVGALDLDPGDVVELYTRQCCLAVTAEDLAVMGCALAAGGVNPVTGDRVADPDACRVTLSVMATAGLYETTGDWLYLVGLPGKSGIAGGVVTVSPGKGALGTYSPRLDGAGNNVRGQFAAAYLSRALGLDLFAVGPSSR